MEQSARSIAFNLDCSENKSLRSNGYGKETSKEKTGYRFSSSYRIWSWDTRYSSFHFQASCFDTSVITVKQYSFWPNQTGFLTLTLTKRLLPLCYLYNTNYIKKNFLSMKKWNCETFLLIFPLSQKALRFKMVDERCINLLTLYINCITFQL